MSYSGLGRGCHTFQLDDDNCQFSSICWQRTDQALAWHGFHVFHEEDDGNYGSNAMINMMVCFPGLLCNAPPDDDDGTLEI